MKRVLAAILFSAAFTGLALADDAEKAMKEMEGNYKLKSAAKGGKPVPVEKAAEIKEMILKDPVVTAWLALVAAGIVWMLGTGASWVTALFIAALLNIAVAGALAFMMRGMFADAPFAATLRQLRGDDFATAREPK